MTRRRPTQPDLLDWQPPETVVRYEEPAVRAATLAGRIAKAVAATLKDCGLARAEVAQQMSAYLGSKVSEAMLAAYASQARDDHTISAVRLIALVHATRDRRLLELVAEMFGWAVIERRHLPLIEIALIRDKEDEMRRAREALTRQARAGGGL